MGRGSSLPETNLRLANQRMSEQISQLLSEWIMDGTLQAGQKISEDELAERFNVSRMPVREAIRSLSERGFLESVPYAGTTVRTITDDEIREVYLLRSVLEPLACQIAVENITQDDIERLKKIQRELETYAEPPISFENAKELYRLNKEFHMCMYSPSKMNRLLQIIDSLWDSIAYIRIRIAYTSIYPKQMQHEHRDYIHYIEQRDSKTLAEQVRKNLEQHAEQIPSINMIQKLDETIKP